MSGAAQRRGLPTLRNMADSAASQHGTSRHLDGMAGRAGRAGRAGQAVRPGRRMSSARTPERRRQRGVRMTVAVSLMAIGSAGVLAALPTGSILALSIASVTAAICGWAALRIAWTEVLQSRREHAADRAATANAYRSLFSERAADHAEFTEAMTDRLALASVTVQELQGALVLAQRDAAEQRVTAERTAAELSQAAARVAELENSIAVLDGELATARAQAAEATELIHQWRPSAERVAEQVALTDLEAGSLEDLIAFDERVAAAQAASATQTSDHRTA